MFAALYSVTALVAALLGTADAPVAIVNGHPLTEQDLALFGLFHRGDLAAGAAGREQLVQELIERQLVRQFLERRKATVPAESVDLRVHQLEESLRSRGDDPPTVYARLGVTADQMRNEVALPLMWKAHVEQTVTSAQIRQYFNEHRSDLDGTRVRVRHLFRKAASPEEIAAAEALLTTVRSDVEQKRTTFVAAVKRHSQSPSAAEGGDVGWIAGRGKLPDEVTAAALPLKPGELAGPIRSPFGVHLIQVTEREPGQLSPEDARPQILERLSERLWADTVADERKRANITLPMAK